MEAASLRVPIAEFSREYEFAASMSLGDLKLGFSIGLPLVLKSLLRFGRH